MISVTYFGLENIAMSKVDVHQDQGGQHEDGQGQVRSVMLKGWLAIAKLKQLSLFIPLFCFLLLLPLFCHC